MFPLRSHRSTQTAATVLTPLARRVDRRVLSGRSFSVRLWDGSELPPPDKRRPQLTITARNPRALAHVVREPNQLGLGRAWVAGDLDVEGDLEHVLRVGEGVNDMALGVRDRLAAIHAGWRLGALTARAPEVPHAEARLRGRRHSRARDRAAVRHHYDVSNAFYRMVLGSTMVYSCGYFAAAGDTLEQAQERKLDVICRKLQLREGERFLDIGCGWGSLVLHAAASYGVRAVGVTLSEPQAELARQRVHQAGLADRCEIRVADYREVADGAYDKVASVGMFEHVGAERLDEYFRRVRGLLRPGGLFLNHGIVRRHAGRADRKTFSARYVFPDGELHSIATVIAAMERAGLEVRDGESLREHYGLTLRAWLANLAQHREEAIAEVGAERERVWRLYMTGSALSFERARISVHQVLTAAPGAAHGLPLVRPGFTTATGSRRDGELTDRAA